MLAIKRAFCVVIVVCLPTLSWAATNSCKFKRGDSNGDGTVQISDAQHLWAYAYTGGPAPPNKDAADANDDGYINGNDSSFITLYLFSGGSPPPDPGPTTADCDPTTTDIWETACTPNWAPLVAWAIPVPSTTGGAAWDCNRSYVHNGVPRKIDIMAENTEATHSECTTVSPTDQLTLSPCCDLQHDGCNHTNTETKWTITWELLSPPVERLAFSTGCTSLQLKLDWRAAFISGGPCGQPGGGCPDGIDTLFWRAENATIKLTFKNQTTLANSVQELGWYIGAMSTIGHSIPLGGFPACAGIDMYVLPATRDRSPLLSNVTWSGNDEWELKKIEVTFLANFDRAMTDDNSDEETIEETPNNGWSIHLETVQYQNL